MSKAATKRPKYQVEKLPKNRKELLKISAKLGISVVTLQLVVKTGTATDEIWNKILSYINNDEQNEMGNDTPWSDETLYQLIDLPVGTTIVSNAIEGLQYRIIKNHGYNVRIERKRGNVVTLRENINLLNFLYGIVPFSGEWTVETNDDN